MYYTIKSGKWIALTLRIRTKMIWSPGSRGRDEGLAGTGRYGHLNLAEERYILYYKVMEKDRAYIKDKDDEVVKRWY